jgi:hypothetical protein
MGTVPTSALGQLRQAVQPRSGLPVGVGTRVLAQHANPIPVIKGPILAVSARHGKVRRDGYLGGQKARRRG